MFKSLTIKITTTMVLMMFICLSILTLISYFGLSDSMQKQMENDGMTLASTIKKEMSNYNVSDLAEVQKIFVGVKEESAGNILYLSISDSNAKIIVSDASIIDGYSLGSSNAEGNTDAVSSATASEKNSAAPAGNNSVGSILTMPNGEKAYNISVPFNYGDNITGTLNIGISLAGMYGQISNTLVIILVAALIIMLITILAALLISKTLTRPITNIVKKLDDFGKGDFTVSFNSKTRDEILKLTNSLNNAVFMLKNAIGSVKATTEKMFGLASELTASGQEATASSEEIANEISTVAAEITEENSNISSILQSMAVFGEKIDSVLRQTEEVLSSNMKIKDTANLGHLKLGELVGSIDDVRNSYNSATKDIMSLNEDVREISEIAVVINSVAEQTNMLALNAAIESARAGEAGKGFAVVADEIRKLAEKVMSSSKNIGNLIIDITKNAQMVVSSSAAISQKLDDQKLITGETVSSLDNISAEVDKTLELMKDVHGSSKDLFTEKGEMINNVEVISGISGKVSGSAQQISASIQNQSACVHQLSTLAIDLDELAEKLKQDIDVFKIIK